MPVTPEMIRVVGACDQPITLLGFDYGLQRIGVAAGQTLTQTTTPLETVSNHHGIPDWTAITRLVSTWSPTCFVVGIPGTAYGGAATDALRRDITEFCQTLTQYFTKPVDTIDEAHSSNAAYALLRTRRRRGYGKRIRREEIDAVAASLLLASWMAEHC